MERICSQPDCSRRHYGRGLCKSHYLSAWTAGTLDQHTRTLVAPGASLDERLRHTGWTVTESGCWEWNGSRNAKNYGQLATGRHAGDDPKRTVPMIASRAAYTAWVGPISDGQVVRHRCDNPPCINPEHLCLGTLVDNVQDAVERKRIANGERKRAQVKLTDAQVAEIRRRVASGETRLALAAEFGVSASLLSMIVAGKRRKSPTNPALPR
ncbi:endonuclease [Gordonia phage Apricot]|uniref:HNH endonuclease n=1 Tax=Gordonia phage Apricot TaxID=2250319 RepID=A0A345L156_9CAUD|nr:endonuclease [Gordonia phage Apricot]AXH49008.1 HNH endonuclease [Gordonia phage Apricot]